MPRAAAPEELQLRRFPGGRVAALPPFPDRIAMSSETVARWLRDELELRAENGDLVEYRLVGRSPDDADVWLLERKVAEPR